jgi:predicted GIY-YIG superfamily endonuclease
MRRWRVYLLHAELPLGGAAHYVGITLRGRLLRRLREHVNGYGTTRTRLLVEHGARLQLARTWATDDKTLETEKTKADQKAGLCPICRGRPRLRSHAINRASGRRCLGGAERTLQFVAFPHDRSEPQKQLRKGQVSSGSS